MLWPDLQKTFSTSLKNPSLAPPPVLGKTAQMTPSIKRFNVYRNNVMLSLIDVLSQTYPVTQQLVGEDFFKATAKVYVGQMLPASPVLSEYGESFAIFLEHFEPAGSVPFLTDLARLEWCWQCAYHGSDHQSISLEQLTKFSEHDLINIRFTFHPTLHFLKSDWPVFSIWQAHQQDHPKSLLENLTINAEAGLILRPHLDVQVLLLHADIFEFYHRLFSGQTLGEAAAILEDHDHDLGAALRLLFDSGAVVAMTAST